MKNLKTKKMITMAMFCAAAFIMVSLIRIPLVPAVPFLHYEPKDVIIVIAGFIYGPLSAFCVSAVVSLIELFTISQTGIIGFIMNIISTCSFACTAAFVYKRVRTMKGAIVGLSFGVVLMVALMLLWNYLITPLYMNIPRGEIVKLLIPAILPFNSIKYILNSALTLIVYKPFVNVLRRANIVEYREMNYKAKNNIPVILAGIFLILVCVLAVFIINR